MGVRPIRTSRPFETFVHEALDLGRPTIRVLQIVPSSSRGIKCILKHVPRHEHDYVCLSYMWKSKYKDLFISVNGKLLKIRGNLWRFLELASQLNIHDWLWVDAICIDQGNIQERNHQVQQMAEIYRQAKHVLVYPGDISWRVRLATKLLIHKKSPEGVRSSEDRWAYELGSLLRCDLSPVTRKRYWERTWIVQEILLAQRVFVVSASGLLPWSAFSAFYMKSSIIEQNQDIELPYLRFLCEWRKGSKPLHGRKLLTLLGNFSDTRCADVRDRVYGLLGLADDAQGLTVDYGRSPAMLLLDVLEHDARQQSGALAAPVGVATLLQRALGVALWGSCGQCTAQNNHKRADCAPTCHKPLPILAYVSGDVQDTVGLTTPSRCFRCGKNLDEDWDEYLDKGSMSLMRPTPYELYFVSTKEKLPKHPVIRCRK